MEKNSTCLSLKLDPVKQEIKIGQEWESVWHYIHLDHSEFKAFK